MADPTIRLLLPADLEGAYSLSSIAGWNQRLDDWRMLLALAPDGSFAAVIDDRIAGTAIGIDYGGFGWIAMMLVDPAFRGQGLGRRLLDAALSALPSDRPIRLDATPMGRPLYREHGFEDETTLTRHVADRLDRVGGNGAGRSTAADMPAIVEHDVLVFGGDRSAVLAWAFDRAPQYARVVRDGAGRPAHYCFGRPGRLFDQVGPVVAEHEADARALVGAALAESAGKALVMDVYDSRQTFGVWLRECGFRGERPLFRMRRPGRRGAPNDGQPRPRSEFAILGPEFA